MKIKVVGRANSEYSTDLFSYIAEFTDKTDRKIDVVDPDSSSGASFCQVYDIVEYPTILVLADDGQVIRSWSGLPLPLMDELVSYS